jgi:hypothetical protein
MKTIDEIKNIAPDLVPYLSPTGKDIPEDYFIGLQESIWKKLAIEESHPPSENYFRKLSLNLSSKITKKRRIKIMRKISGIAAAILFLIAVGTTFIPAQQNAEELVDPELALFYLEENIDQWNVGLIADYDLIQEENLQDLYTTEDEIITSYLDYIQPEDINLDFLEELE